MILCPFCFKMPTHEMSGNFICRECRYAFAYSVIGFYFFIIFDQLSIHILPIGDKQLVIIYNNSQETDRFEIEKFELCESMQILNKIYKLKYML